jgi:hypothetical protein
MAVLGVLQAAALVTVAEAAELVIGDELLLAGNAYIC